MPLAATSGRQPRRLSAPVHRVQPSAVQSDLSASERQSDPDACGWILPPARPKALFQAPTTGVAHHRGADMSGQGVGVVEWVAVDVPVGGSCQRFDRVAREELPGGGVVVAGSEVDESGFGVNNRSRRCSVATMDANPNGRAGKPARNPRRRARPGRRRPRRVLAASTTALGVSDGVGWCHTVQCPSPARRAAASGERRNGSAHGTSSNAAT